MDFLPRYILIVIIHMKCEMTCSLNLDRAHFNVGEFLITVYQQTLVFSVISVLQLLHFCLAEGRSSTKLRVGWI